MKLSYSRIQKFMDCPYNYYLRYVEKEPDPSGVYGKFGSLMHSVCEYYIEEGHPEEIDAGICQEILEDVWEDVPYSFYDEALKCIAMWAVCDRIRYKHILSTEEPFYVKIGKHTVRGYWDRVEDWGSTLKIADYKTKRALYSKSDLTHDLQADIYNLAARQRYPDFSRVKVEFVMLQYGICQRINKSEKDARRTESFLRSIVHQIEASDFPARIGQACSFCAYTDLCDEFQDNLDNPVLGDMSDDLEGLLTERDKIQNYLKNLNRRKKELDSELRVRLKDGDLSTKGHSVYLNPVRENSYPLIKTLDLLSHFSGVSPMEIMEEVGSLPISKVEKYAAQTAFYLTPSDAKKLQKRLKKVKVTGKGSPRLVVRKKGK